MTLIVQNSDDYFAIIRNLDSHLNNKLYFLIEVLRCIIFKCNGLLPHALYISICIQINHSDTKT